MAEKTMTYFAYGSNMEPKQMNKRLEHCVAVKGIARLDGYRFGYWGHSSNWSLAGTADITQSDNDHDYVLGVLYERSNQDFESLDKYEHVATGRYKRQLFSVIFKEIVILAFAYVLKRDGTWQYLEERNAPSQAYAKQCANAAFNMRIPKDYIDKYILQVSVV
jgi:gamma-glutamylcyclotransferase (GGCT)/AIG2-like uncharacterized protein YtfP